MFVAGLRPGEGHFCTFWRSSEEDLQDIFCLICSIRSCSREMARITVEFQLLSTFFCWEMYPIKTIFCQEKDKSITDIGKLFIRFEPKTWILWDKMKKTGFQEWNPMKNLSRENPWNNPVEIPWRILLLATMERREPARQHVSSSLSSRQTNKKTNMQGSKQTNTTKAKQNTTNKHKARQHVSSSQASKQANKKTNKQTSRKTSNKTNKYNKGQTKHNKQANTTKATQSNKKHNKEASAISMYPPLCQARKQTGKQTSKQANKYGKGQTNQ